MLQLINDAHVYDPAQKTWQKLPTRAPLGLVGAAAFTHGERIYIIGGSNSPIFNGYFQDYSAAGDDEARKQAVMRPILTSPRRITFSIPPSLATSRKATSGTTKDRGRFPVAPVQR